MDINLFGHFPSYLVFFILFSTTILNPKTAGGSHYGFSKGVSFKEREKPCFFVTSNVISLIFPESFLEISHVLVSKKLVISAYNRWCQYFFFFNIFQTECLTIPWSHVNIRLVLEIWRRGQIDTSLPYKKTSLKKASLIRVNPLISPPRKGSNIQKQFCWLLPKCVWLSFGIKSPRVCIETKLQQ